MAAAVAYVLYRLRFVFVTVTLAAMLTYALEPIVEMAERWRVAGASLPRFTAVLVVMVGIAGILVGIGSVAAGPLGEAARQLAERSSGYREHAQAALDLLREWSGRTLPPDVQPLIDDAIARTGRWLVGAFGLVLQTTAQWLSHVLELALVPILAFYFLADLPGLREELPKFLPASARAPALLAARRLDRILAGYVRGQIILMGIAAVVVWAGLALLSVPSSLLLGIVAGLTRSIPIIGPIVGAVPIVGLAALQSPGLGVLVLVFFSILQLVESKLILPQVIGVTVHLHAATIIVALLVGNALFGLMGMFLAVPVAAFVKEAIGLWDSGFPQPDTTASH